MTSQRRVADSGFTSGLGVPCREEAERGRRCRRGALKNRAVAAVTYDAAIGLGANLGDPLATLAEASVQLSGLGRITGASALYRTAAIGPPQPDFLNAVVALRCSLSPSSLMAALLQLEARLGRVRRERWGPRTIDLDLLWIDGLALSGETLCVPHPRLEQRRFALEPLLDVYPQACHPLTGRPYASLLCAVLDQEARRATDVRWMHVAASFGLKVNNGEARARP